jgi:hypothetical protein
VPFRMPPTPVCLLISGLGGSIPSRTPRGAHPLRPCAASRCRLSWHRALRRYISTSTSIDSTASIEGRTPVIFPALRRSSSSRISSSLTRCGMGVGSVTAWRALRQHEHDVVDKTTPMRDERDEAGD